MVKYFCKCSHSSLSDARCLVLRGFLITEALASLESFSSVDPLLAAGMFTHVMREHWHLWAGLGNIWMLRLAAEWVIFYIWVSRPWSVG